MFLMRAGADVAMAPLVLSPSDLRLAAECEFATVRRLDVLLGRTQALPDEAVPMLERIAALGIEHEQAQLRRLRSAHPGEGAIVQFGMPDYTPTALTEAMETTLAALRSDAEVLYQATFFDGAFVGHADFLERTDDGWLVSDTKLARSAGVAALLQISAYADQLQTAGVPTAPVARLVLGDGDALDFPLADLLPAYRSRRHRLDMMLTEHREDDAPAAWGDPRWLACGRCAICTDQVEAHRDVLLVAGMRGPARHALAQVGAHTIDDLAQRAEAVPGIRERTLTRLRAQARLQLAGERANATSTAGSTTTVLHEVTDLTQLDLLPEPSPGDLFFDFEGDPLWRERGSSTWGLEYLFGMVEVDTGEPVFRTFWAHDRAAERQALIDFVDHVNARRGRWPDLHVYHYAAYEKSALLRLAARFGVYEDEVDQLLRDGVFVDLYATVRSGIRASARSYSLKKLEPLFMPDRTGEVTAGDESIVVYHQHVAARIAGQDAQADRLLSEIAEYNEQDCISTLRLRDWLLGLRDNRADQGERTGPLHDDADTEAAEIVAPAPSPRRAAQLALEAEVRATAGDVAPADRTTHQQARAMIASSVLFHARENKPRWQRHFERLAVPPQDWDSDDDVVVASSVEVQQDWHKQGRQRSHRRHLVMDGEPLRGVPVSVGTTLSTVYAAPTPAGIDVAPGHRHGVRTGATVIDAEDSLSDSGRLRQRLVLEELEPADGGLHPDLPVALVPGDSVSTATIDDALSELARQALAEELPRSAGIDLLLRVPPRLHDPIGAARSDALPGDGAPHQGLPGVGQGARRHIDAITTALRSLDRSYLAVQGPPGTGKTWVGARVIADLVSEHGWRVGVCAQSHAAIENVLDAVVEAGLAPDVVGKRPKGGGDRTWSTLATADGLARFAAEHSAAERGYVIGGTAWDLTNTKRVGRGQLDLLVIDEAGQFSLANTLAVSLAADRLLLLGDPQQLDQVSTGTHAEPVNSSALGWLIGPHAVLPAEFGYFLETTWRLHPALCHAVSHLSYDDRLGSREDITAARALEGLTPGLHVEVVDHVDNATWSPQEADRVVHLVADLLGRTWTDPVDEAAAHGRPLGQGDILVITPYNAQRGLLRRFLDDAGYDGVRVGTVDTFQGQQAPVVIMSMAASSPSDVSRGLGFLLSRNRLNVAVSRGQYAAFLVRSAVLTEFAPRTPQDLLALGAFLGLCENSVA